MSAVNEVPATLALAHDQFVDRHVGSDASELAQMLRVLGVDSLAAMVRKTVPEAIRLQRPLDDGTAQSRTNRCDAIPFTSYRTFTAGHCQPSSTANR